MRLRKRRTSGAKTFIFVLIMLTLGVVADRTISAMVDVYDKYQANQAWISDQRAHPYYAE